tara:strand:+ start:996 stop:1844 length:849 start_codon:yes stop_codon:yes gene_type:complete
MKDFEVKENKIWWNTEGFTSFEELSINHSHYSKKNIGDIAWCYSHHQNVDTVYIGSKNLNFEIWDWDVQNKSKIKLKNTYQDFDFNSPFILFTGHSGGGTSIISKFFRKLGVHFGDDCGKEENEKPIESSSLRIWWNLLDYPNSIDRIKEGFKQVVGHYNFKPNKINAVKLVNYTTHDRALKMGKMLPNLKVVCILKKPSKVKAFHKEGANFKKKDLNSILNVQMVKVEGNKIFHLDWKKFFTDYKYCNEVIKFVGLSKIFKNKEELEKFNTNIGFKTKYLD